MDWSDIFGLGGTDFTIISAYAPIGIDATYALLQDISAGTGGGLANFMILKAGAECVGALEQAHELGVLTEAAAALENNPSGAANSNFLDTCAVVQLTTAAAICRRAARHCRHGARQCGGHLVAAASPGRRGGSVHGARCVRAGVGR